MHRILPTAQLDGNCNSRRKISEEIKAQPFVVVHEHFADNIKSKACADPGPRLSKKTFDPIGLPEPTNDPQRTTPDETYAVIRSSDRTKSMKAY